MNFHGIFSRRDENADENQKAQRQNLGLRRVSILLALIIFISFLAYQIDIAIPGTPSINNTYSVLQVNEVHG